jgi:hypothetical protein
MLRNSTLRCFRYFRPQYPRDPGHVPHLHSRVVAPKAPEAMGERKIITTEQEAVKARLPPAVTGIVLFSAT